MNIIKKVCAYESKQIQLYKNFVLRDDHISENSLLAHSGCMVLWMTNGWSGNQPFLKLQNFAKLVNFVDLARFTQFGLKSVLNLTLQSYLNEK